MNVTLTPEQETWLETHVAKGRFPSIEEALRHVVDEHIAAHAVEAYEDLAWAKPYVDEGLAALEHGEFMSLEEHKARNAARLKP